MTVWGFSLAALAYATVLGVAVIRWRERLLGVWLQLALLLNCLWAGYLAFDGHFDVFNRGNWVFLEILRDLAWLLLVLKLNDFGRGGRDFWSLKTPWIAICLALVALLINLIDVLFSGVVVKAGITVAYFAPLLFVTAIIISAEQWFRNIPLDQRWPVKFLLIALGMLFVYDFILYSEALLFNRVDGELWRARGWINVLAAPLVAISISRATEWNRELRVSRRAIFFTTSLVLSGCYLIVMSLVGYYVKWFGPSVGGAVQIVFTVSGVALFIILVSSGRVRSQITVWLNKHFLSYKYDYRKEWMQANARLASLPMDDRYYHELLVGITAPIGSRGGVLWIIESDSVSVADAFNVSFRESLDAYEDASLLAFMESSGWVVDLHEYQLKPELYTGVSIRDGLFNTGLWLLVPLLRQGRMIGVVGLARPVIEQPVNWEDFDLLKALGEQLASMIELKRTSDSLMQARQFEAYNQLSTFVVHDIKNVVAQLSLVVRNAEKHRNNPEFIDDALSTLASAVGRMNRMLTQLKQSGSHGPKVFILAREILDKVVANQSHGRPIPRLSITDEADCSVLVDKERLITALCHLVQNAQEATSDDGEVMVSVYCKGDVVCFLIKDSGIGMDTEFINHSLFKPFVTSKGRAGMGIGVFEARQFARQNGGDLSVKSALGKGSLFTLVLPKATAASDQELSDAQG